MFLNWFRRPVLTGRSFLLEQLEERIVLDAAVAASTQDTADHKDQTTQGAEQAAAATPAASAEAAAAPTQAAADAAASGSQSDPLGTIYSQDLSVVLISNAIADVEAVSNAVAADAQVVVYDAQQDTLASIEQKLGDLVASSGQAIDHLAILSHGESGVLKLGPTTVFTAASVEANPTLWTALGTLLAQDARIDLYGCSIGEGAQGIALVQAIADTTAATVWASSDMTGNISGADWDLEVKSGESSLGSLIDPASIDVPGFYLASAPIADSQSVTVNEDGSLNIIVTGRDADDPAAADVSFEVTNSVDHGTLTPLGPVVRTSAGHYSQEFLYTPTPDYHGSDSLQFVLKTPNCVWDGFAPETNLGPQADSTYSVAVGDVNNDGNPDVVVGNDGQPNRVYLGNGDGTFTLYGNVSGEVATTYSIVLGDLNHDGYLDLVTGNFDRMSKVYQGIGNGAFMERDAIGAGADDTISIALGDVNNDGIIDIISGNNSAASKVYLGNGDVTFRDGGTFGSAGDGTESVAVGDLNGDGNLDIVAGNLWTSNRVYLGNGDGTFTPRGSSGTSDTNTESVALGDVNGDGNLDLVVGTWGQTNKVYLGNGNGGFSLSATVGWDNTLSVKLGDVNGDGYLDVVTGNAYYRNLEGAPNKVYLGNGSGGFAYYGELGTNADRTCSLAIGDLNRDGYLDVIAGNDNPPNGTNSRVYLNMGGYVVTDTSAPATVNIHVNGTPTDMGLSPTTVAENEPSGTGVGTFSTTDPDTGDTHSYALVAGSGSTDNGSFTIDGNQLKAAASFDYETKSSYSIRVRTTDADGLWYEEAFTVTVTDVNEAPTVTSAVAASVPENTTGTVYTATGTDPDAGDTLTWTLSGTDAALFNINSTTGAVSFRVAPDFESPADGSHDNIYDFTVTATDTRGLTAFKDVAITVTDVNEIPVADNQAVTVNEDGALTITVTGSDGDDPDVSLVRFEVTSPVTHGTLSALGPVVRTSGGHYSQQFLYTPNPDDNGADSLQFVLKTPDQTAWEGFAAGTAVATEADCSRSMALGDVNGDGNLDLAVGTWGQGNKLYLGNGDGSFAAGYAIGTITYYTCSVAFGDVNDDGSLDLVVGTWGQGNKVYLGNGDGSFAAGYAIGAATDYTRSVAIGDVNNDGSLDVIVGNYAQTNNVYLGNGDGSFGAGTAIGTDTDYTRSLALGDVNNDGIRDLIVGNSGGTNKVYLGNGDGTFAAGHAIGTDANDTYSLALGDVNNDGSLDVIVGNYAQTNKVYLGNGHGSFGAGTAIGTDTGFTLSVALGDVNNDGEVDVIAGNDSQANEAYLNSGCPVDTSAAATVLITVTAVNDAPVVVVPADQVMNEDSTLVVNGIVVSDLDAAEGTGTGQVEVTLSVDHGVVTLASTAGIVFAPGDANGTAAMTFTGLVADVNTALNDLQYTPSPDYYGADAITVDVNDLGNTGAPGALNTTEKVNITVIDVPDGADEPAGKPLIEEPSSPFGLFGFGPYYLGGTTGPVDIGGAEGGAPIFFGSGFGGGPVVHHGGTGPETGEGFGGIDLPGLDPASGHGPIQGAGSGQLPTSQPTDLTGLANYHDSVLQGKMLVFNLDDIHFTDLCTDCVFPTTSRPEIPTGVAGYYEAIKAGKTLVFNLSDLTCMDIFCAPGA